MTQPNVVGSGPASAGLTGGDISLGDIMRIMFEATAGADQRDDPLKTLDLSRMQTSEWKRLFEMLAERSSDTSIW
jgi:hypothetical protein